MSEIWDNFTEFCVERGCKYQVLLLEVMVAFHLPNTSQVIRKSFRLETSVKDIRSEAERVIEEQAVAAGWIGPAPPAAGDDSNAETQTPPPYEDPNDRQHGCPSSALGHAHAGVKLCIGNRLVLRDGNRLLDYARRGENGMWEEVFLRCELDRP